MTNQTLANNLKSNPEFIISFIVQNNPKAVWDNLNALGIAVTMDPRDLFEKILRYGSNPEFQDSIIKAIDVPICQASLTDEFKAELNTKTSTITNRSTDTFNYDSPDGPEPMPESWLQPEPEPEETGNRWDWGQIGSFFSALGSGLGGYVSGSQTPQLTEIQLAAQLAADKKRNKTIIIAVASIITAIILALIFTKKKK